MKKYILFLTSFAVFYGMFQIITGLILNGITYSKRCFNEYWNKPGSYIWTSRKRFVYEPTINRNTSLLLYSKINS